MPEPTYVQTTDTLEIQRTKINDLVDWKADLNPSTLRLEDAQAPAMHLTSPVILPYSGVGGTQLVDISSISAGSADTGIINDAGSIIVQGFENDTAPIGTQFRILTIGTETMFYCDGTGNIYRNPPGSDYIYLNAGEIITFRKTAVNYWEIVHVSDNTNFTLGEGGPGNEAGTPTWYMDLTPGQKYYRYGTFSFLNGFWQPHKFFQRGMTIYVEITGAGGDVLTHSANLQLPNELDITVATGDIFEFMLVDHTNNYWRMVGSNRQFTPPLAMGASGEAAKSIPVGTTWIDIPTGGTGGGTVFYQVGIIGFSDFPVQNMIFLPNVNKFRIYAGALYSKQSVNNPATDRELQIEWYDGNVVLHRTFNVRQRGGDDDVSQQESGIHFVSPPLDGTLSGGAFIKAYTRHGHSAAIIADVYMAVEVIEY